MDNYICSNCPFLSKWRFSIEEHTKIHVITPVHSRFQCTSIINYFECFLCQNYKTHSYCAYKNHMNKFHNVNKSTEKKIEFKCEECCFVSKSKIYIKIHFKRKHVKKHKLHKCLQCEYQTYIKVDLNNHLRNKHSTLKTIKCPHCEYLTHRKVNLNRHIKNNHTVDSAINWHQCTYCIYKCKRAYQLNSHINAKHTSNEDKTDQFLNCPHCQKSIKKRCLKNHIFNRHIPDSERNWYECTKCSFKTKRSFHLKQHILAKHASEQEKIEKLMGCSLCEYQTLFQSNLAYHFLSKHNSANCFRCEYCSYKTSNKANLERHQKSKRIWCYENRLTKVLHTDHTYERCHDQHT